MDSKNFYLLLFVLSIMAFLPLLFIDDVLESINYRPKSQIPGLFSSLMLTEVTLMGQFNFPDLENYTKTWCQEWSRVFPQDSIIIAIPEEAKKQHAQTCDVMGYPINQREINPGHVTPYTNLARVMRKVSNQSKGILYVHDDLMVSKNLLQKIRDNGKQWISIKKYPGKVEVYLNGSSNDIGGVSDGWMWWNGCESTVREVFASPQIVDYLKKNEKGEQYLEGFRGSADMLYLSLHSEEQTEAFLVLLDLFGKH